MPDQTARKSVIKNRRWITAKMMSTQYEKIASSKTGLSYCYEKYPMRKKGYLQENNTVTVSLSSITLSDVTDNYRQNIECLLSTGVTYY